MPDCFYTKDKLFNNFLIIRSPSRCMYTKSDMTSRDELIYETKTKYGRYQVVDMLYNGREARILFIGNREAAFSGIPLDGEHELLFDYIQRLYEITSTIRPKKLLIIGGGVYTLPMAIFRTLPDVEMDVVEIDEGLNDIAEAFFGFQKDRRINIINQDGSEFLKNTSKKYDMIILDAFSGLEIPDSMKNKHTTQLIESSLNPNGIIAMNVISSYRGRNSKLIKEFYYSHEELYTHTNVYQADSSLLLWSVQNLILVAQKHPNLEHYGLRYGPLGRPMTI